MTSVGPYEFTDQDVETTLAIGLTFFDLLTEWLPPSATEAVAGRRARSAAALDDDDVSRAAALAVLWEEWRAAMADLRALGAYGPSSVGTAAGLFRSDGGVPKLPEHSVEVDLTGVVGDRQSNRLHHGRPFQALCLWSTEVIDAFRAQGHPIAPGRAGENVTITGLPWDRVKPGVQLRIGDVLAEVSSYAVPCFHNAPWFTDGMFGLMHHRHGPVSRVYATVLEPGRVSVADPVLLEP